VLIVSVSAVLCVSVATARAPLPAGATSAQPSGQPALPAQASSTDRQTLPLLDAPPGFEELLQVPAGPDAESRLFANTEGSLGPQLLVGWTWRLFPPGLPADKLTLGPLIQTDERWPIRLAELQWQRPEGIGDRASLLQTRYQVLDSTVRVVDLLFTTTVPGAADAMLRAPVDIELPPEGVLIGVQFLRGERLVQLMVVGNGDETTLDALLQYARQIDGHLARERAPVGDGPETTVTWTSGAS
jgi:hypothetical protein